jgi:hypothetical protein
MAGGVASQSGYTCSNSFLLTLWQLIGDARGATPAQQRNTKEADAW